MAPKRVTTMRVDDELLDGLRQVWDRDGITVAEQVRRAIRAWLAQKGVSVKKAERKRATPRKRP